MTSQKEPAYVEECPSCGARFVGMSPEEFRDRHVPECNPLLKLLRFKGVSGDV